MQHLTLVEICQEKHLHIRIQVCGTYAIGVVMFPKVQKRGNVVAVMYLFLKI